MTNDNNCGAGHLRRRRTAALGMAFVFALSVFGAVAAYHKATSIEQERAASVAQMEANGQTLLAYAGDNLEEMIEPAKDRTFSVTVLCDGELIEMTATWGDSVEEVITRSGVVLGEDDQLSHIPERPISPGDQIVVERWTRDQYTEQEEIPFETVKTTSSLIRPGRVCIVYEGTPGIYERTYERIIVNGRITDKTLLSEKLISEPIPQRVLVGEAGVPVSPLDFKWEFDENGIPVDYADVLAGSRSAGYSARAGAGTASGRKAAVGHVAVDPSVIPYGSKLYIASPDGSFVYGYAIAADTGTALMQGLIEVDLFYGSYAESCLNEIRTVDIYILEYPESAA